MSDKKKKWQMEYYNGSQRVRFTVNAKDFDEAVKKGDSEMTGFRRTATYQTQ